MNDEISYKNNPLHSLGLKDLLTELVDHYGFEILFAYLTINCFKTKPSIESSVKFLKKTDWAREKVEGFYLYQFKNLPRVSSAQFSVPPRDRIIPNDQKPGEPAELNLEDAERLRIKREKKAAEHNKGSKFSSGKKSFAKDGYAKRKSSFSRSDSPSSSQSNDKASSSTSDGTVDPWASWKK